MIVAAPFAITGIGSLPFADFSTAARVIAEHCPDTPFSAQLNDGTPYSQMVLEPLRPFSALIDAGAFGAKAAIRKGSEEEFLALAGASSGSGFSDVQARYLDALQSAVRAPLIFKSQLVGPVTLLSQLQYAGKRVLDCPRLAAALISHLSKSIETRISDIKSRFDCECVFMIDEPVLPFMRKIELAPSSAAYKYLARTTAGIKSFGALSGLHCCAPMPGAFFPSMFEELALDALSFAIEDSATPMAETISGEYLSKLAANGGHVLLGVMATRPERVRRNPRDEAATLLSTLAQAKIDVESVADNLMLTAQCGLMLNSEQAATESFLYANQLRTHLIER